MSNQLPSKKEVREPRLLGWVHERTRVALFSTSRAERDRALSDVNYWTQDYAGRWTQSDGNHDPNRIWCGEQP